MRTIPPGSFERLTRVDALWAAWRGYARGKRRRPAVAAFDLDADARVIALHRSLRQGRYRPSSFQPMVVRDPKLRLIAVPTIIDRIVHHAVVDALRPVFDPRLIEHCYASRPRLGPQRAVLAHLRWTRRHLWRLSLDIRRYFPSIDREVLLGGIVRPRIRDGALARLVTELVNASEGLYRTPLAVEVLGLQDDPVPRGVGLPIGSSLSQWAANLYLDGLDHFVKRRLKVPGYLRYLDDFVLFDHDAARLQEARAAVREWLWERRRLRLNPKRWSVHPTTDPSVFLGYRVTRAGVAPSRKLLRRMKGKVRAAAGKGPAALERTIASYGGLVSFGGHGMSRE